MISVKAAAESARQLAAGHRGHIIAIIVLAVGLRAFHLGFKSLWLDEAVVYELSLGSISEVVAENAIHNSAPPLYPILVRAVRSHLGDNEATLRILSFLFGAASIPAIYWFARRSHSRQAGLIASFLAATSVSQIRYAQQLREYSLAVLLAAVYWLILISLLRDPSWKLAILAAVVAVTSIFSQYGLSVLVVIGLLSWSTIVLLGEKRGIRHGIIVYLLLSASAAIAAVFAISLEQHLRPGGFAADSYLRNAYWKGSGLPSLLEFLTTNTMGLFDFSHESGPILVLLVSLGAFRCLESRRGRQMLLILVTQIVTIIGLAIANLYPYHGGRQGIMLTPALYVLGGIGGSWVTSGSTRRTRTCVLLAILGFYSLIPRPTGLIWYMASTTPEHSRPVASELVDEFRSGDVIYSNWLGGYALRYYLRDHPQLLNQIQFLSDNPGDAIEQIDRIGVDRQRTWVFISHCDGACSEVHESIQLASSIRPLVVENGVWLYVRED